MLPEKEKHMRYRLIADFPTSAGVIQDRTKDFKRFC